MQTLVAHNKHTWRTLFWLAAGLSFFAACIRAVLPESEFFLRAHAETKARAARGEAKITNKTKTFLRETKEMLKLHWLRCIYAVLLMTGKILPFSTLSLLPSESKFLRFQFLEVYCLEMIASRSVLSFRHVQSRVARYISNLFNRQQIALQPSSHCSHHHR
jgi:hypothetical protein